MESKRSEFVCGGEGRPLALTTASTAAAKATAMVSMRMVLPTAYATMGRHPIQHRNPHASAQGCLPSCTFLRWGSNVRLNDAEPGFHKQPVTGFKDSDVSGGTCRG